MEIGVAPNGAYGTGNNAPTGYHPRPGGGSQLGFVSDPDKDGFTVGIPDFCGDYFLPGYPQEGWDIQVGKLWAKAWRGTSATSMTGGLTGSNVSYSFASGIYKNTWEGAVAGVAIRQITILKKEKLYFLIRVTLKNTTASEINDIYYDRTLDPDNTSTMGGLPGVITSSGAVTKNVIEYKLPNEKSRTLVSAVGALTIAKPKQAAVLIPCHILFTWVSAPRIAALNPTSCHQVI